MLLPNAGLIYPFGLALHNFSLYITHVYHEYKSLKTMPTSGGQASVAQLFPEVRDRPRGLVMYNSSRTRGLFVYISSAQGNNSSNSFIVYRFQSLFG